MTNLTKEIEERTTLIAADMVEGFIRAGGKYQNNTDTIEILAAMKYGAFVLNEFLNEENIGDATRLVAEGNLSIAPVKEGVQEMLKQKLAGFKI
jgi:hypothetical protein